MTSTEINEAVARKLGWKLHKTDNPRAVYSERWFPPDFDSTKSMNFCENIEAAWEIVDWFRKNNIFVVLCVGKTYVTCRLLRDGTDLFQEEADTLPRAVCQAFLRLDVK